MAALFTVKKCLVWASEIFSRNKTQHALTGTSTTAYKMTSEVYFNGILQEKVFCGGFEPTTFRLMSSCLQYFLPYRAHLRTSLCPHKSYLKMYILTNVPIGKKNLNKKWLTNKSSCHAGKPTAVKSMGSKFTARN